MGINDVLPIFEALPGKYLILKPDAPRFTIAGVTRDYLKATLTKKEEIIGRGVFEVFTDNPGNQEATGVQNLLASLNQVTKSKSDHKIDQKQRYDIFSAKENSYVTRYWTILNKPVIDEHGKLLFIINSVKDVTKWVLLKESERKAVNDANAQRQLLYNIFLQAPVAIAMLHAPNFAFEFVNDRMLEYLDRTREQALYKPVFEVLPEVAGQGFENLLNRVIATGKRYVGNEMLVKLNRNGRLEDTYINFLYEPYFGKDGVITGVIVVASEITEIVLSRKVIEENAEQLEQKVRENTADLKNANLQLQRSNKQLKEFAYAASHDLQEPLRKISTFINLISESEKEVLSDKSKILFGKVIAATDRMNMLITDLFTLSKISNHNQSLQEVDLNEVMEKVAEDLSLEIEQSGAVIVKDDLSVIHGIPRQIQQLFQNLLSNAIKYAKKGEPPVIHIKHELVTTSEQKLYDLLQHATYCKLIFEDNGIGFPQEYADKIFQMFYRLHGKAEYSGTGIGLAICRSIAENHKGTIIAESEEGKGSRFEVYLKC